MTCSKNMAWVGGIILLLIVAIKCLYWWADTPPKRPSNVPSDAIWIWALPTGLPSPKRGDRAKCWFDLKQNVNRCRVTCFNGEHDYEGTFLPYEGHAPLPEIELVIDCKRTNLAQERVGLNATSLKSDSPGTKYIPLIYLRNGEVLIPEKGYESDLQRLDKLHRRQPQVH